MIWRRGRRGFTLIELLVVLLVLAVIGGATVPALLGAREADDDLTAAARTVQSLFQLARDSAISSRTPVTVVIDSTTALVWLLTEAPSRLSADGTMEGAGFGLPEQVDRVTTAPTTGVPLREDGTSLELPASVDLQLGMMRARFIFLPTGATMADSVVLRSGASQLTLTLDPWTGDVLAR